MFEPSCHITNIPDTYLTYFIFLALPFFMQTPARELLILSHLSPSTLEIVATIPSHLSLSSAALRESPNPIPIHSLMLSSDGAPLMTLQQYLPILPCLPLPSGNLQTPFPSIPWSFNVIFPSLFLSLSFLLLSLSLAELFSPCQRILRCGLVVCLGHIFSPAVPTPLQTADLCRVTFS